MSLELPVIREVLGAMSMPTTNLSSPNLVAGARGEVGGAVMNMVVVIKIVPAYSGHSEGLRRRYRPCPRVLSEMTELGPQS